MNVENFFRQRSRWWFRLPEKGGKLHDVPAHHKAADYVDEYLMVAGLDGQKGVPLFQSVTPRGELTGRRLHRLDILRMVKRRAKAAGLSTAICCHSFRATGITAYLLGGGQLEHAQRIASHESPKTTKLYDRTDDTISMEEIEKIAI